MGKNEWKAMFRRKIKKKNRTFLVRGNLKITLTVLLLLRWVWWWKRGGVSGGGQKNLEISRKNFFLFDKEIVNLNFHNVRNHRRYNHHFFHLLSLRTICPVRLPHFIWYFFFSILSYFVSLNTSSLISSFYAAPHHGSFLQIHC